MSETDPTTAARKWLAANPDHEAAVHVRAGLDSADRYEALSQEMAGAIPGGSTVVIMTLGDPDGRVVLTSPDWMEEKRIAAFLGNYVELILSVDKDLSIKKVREYLGKRAASLAGRMARRKIGTTDEAYARGALEEVTRLRTWIEGKL